jgi:hypothetical protein
MLNLTLASEAERIVPELVEAMPDIGIALMAGWVELVPRGRASASATTPTPATVNPVIMMMRLRIPAHLLGVVLG